MTSSPTILIAGASRGLGQAMAAEFLKKDWTVIATVRDPAARTPLHDLLDQAGGRLEIETLDVTCADQTAALKDRLSGRALDMLFVNAGIASREPMQPIGRVAADDFTHVMLTNALGPMQVIETFEPNLASQAVVGVMSSGLGSIANNTMGGYDAYRGSKAALNMFMRTLAARQPGRPMVVMAPGWVRTDMGGPGAPLGVEDSIPSLVNVLIAKQGRPGPEYLDYLGRTVPW